MGHRLSGASLVALIGASVGSCVSAMAGVQVKIMEPMRNFGFPKERKDLRRARSWKLNKQRANQLSNRGVSRPVARRR